MSWLEVVIALIGRAQFLAWFVIVLGVAGATFMHLCAWDKRTWPTLYGGEERAELKAQLYEGIRNKFLLGLFMMPLLFVPSIDDIWRVRIGLIKLHLASPENVQKGADVIERLGKKLECKYLGCEEPKETK